MSKLRKLAVARTEDDTRLSAVLQLSLAEGLSIRAVARRLRLPRKTVCRLLGREHEREPPTSAPRPSRLDTHDVEIRPLLPMTRELRPPAIPKRQRPSDPTPTYASGTGTTSSPCVGCLYRTTCSSPCAALAAIIPPEHSSSYKEVSSEALMGGYLRAAAVPPVELVSDEPPEFDDLLAAVSPRSGALRRALSGLPDAHRHVIVEYYSGLSAGHIARECRTSSQVIHALVRQSLSWLADEVGAALHIKNGNQIEHAEDTMSDPLNGPKLRPINSVPCAEPGCTKLVSASPAARADLAPFCATHRRLYTKDDQRLVPVDERLPAGAPPLPTSDERRAVDRLRSRVGDGAAEVVLMTPGMAMVLLERNSGNRKLARARIEVYARDMIAGAWQVNNQGIALGADGMLLDGQHRLYAVIRARCTVPMLVVCGLDESVRATIDQGRPRSLSDNLHILDGTSDGARLVAWFKAIEHLVSGRPKPLSHAIIRRQLQRYDVSVQWFLAHAPRMRPFNKASLIGALLYAHRVAATETEHFTRRYATGADLPAGSPVLTLRDYAVSGHEPSRTVSLKVLRCLLADARGERIERLYASEEGLAHFRQLHQQLESVVLAA